MSDLDLEALDRMVRRYKKLPQIDPPPELDAKILRMARAPTVAKAARPKWPVWIASAAVVVLAVGVGLRQFREAPLGEPRVRSEAEVAKSVAPAAEGVAQKPFNDDDRTRDAMREGVADAAPAPAPEPPELQTPAAPAPAAAPAPVAATAPTSVPTEDSSPLADHRDAELDAVEVTGSRIARSDAETSGPDLAMETDAAAKPAAVAPPQDAPREARSQRQEAEAFAEEAHTPASAEILAKSAPVATSDAGASADEQRRAAGALGVAANRTGASADRKRAQSASAGERKMHRQTPARWLEEIRALRARGELDAARRELAAFRAEHPKVAVPADLADLR